MFPKQTSNFKLFLLPKPVKASHPIPLQCKTCKTARNVSNSNIEQNNNRKQEYSNSFSKKSKDSMESNKIPNLSPICKKKDMSKDKIDKNNLSKLYSESSYKQLNRTNNKLMIKKSKIKHILLDKEVPKFPRIAKTGIENSRNVTQLGGTLSTFTTLTHQNTEHNMIRFSAKKDRHKIEDKEKDKFEKLDRLDRIDKPERQSLTKLRQLSTNSSRNIDRSSFHQPPALPQTLKTLYKSTDPHKIDIKPIITKKPSNRCKVIQNKEELFIEQVVHESDKKYPIENIFKEYTDYPEAKYSLKKVNEYIRTYSVNSYQGMIRNYNEDKVSIILSIFKPQNVSNPEEWPEHISFLAVYDGHSGSGCCQYLQEKLHNYIFKSKFFPKDPEQAIKNGFEKCENSFINKIAEENKDHSGSCALILLILDNVAYVANCGDSRGIISFNQGKIIHSITNDHKPNDDNERFRIVKHGGTIIKQIFKCIQESDDAKLKTKDIYRFIPGGLSVSRSFGDCHIKLEKYGGRHGILIAEPDVFKINLDDKDTVIDFIILGCDGIFDFCSTEDVGKSVWNVIDNYNKGNSKLKEAFNDIHELSGGIADMIIKTAMINGSLDNVTTIFLGFEGFENAIMKYNESVCIENKSTYYKG